MADDQKPPGLFWIERENLRDPFSAGLLSGFIGLMLAMTAIDMNKPPSPPVPYWVYDAALLLIWGLCALVMFGVGYSIAWFARRRSSPPGS